MAARNKDYCQAARVFAQAAREYKAQGDEARLNHTLLQVHMNRQQCSERQGPRPPSTVASGTADKCRAGTDPKQCVVLEQRGKSGRWHNYRLVNSCNRAFDVKVFSCNADWAGGCKVESQRVGACVTTGSVTEGKQSWDRDAELRL
jgi:hypothetical protein